MNYYTLRVKWCHDVFYKVVWWHVWGVLWFLNEGCFKFTGKFMMKNLWKLVSIWWWNYSQVYGVTFFTHIGQTLWAILYMRCLWVRYREANVAEMSESMHNKHTVCTLLSLWSILMLDGPVLFRNKLLVYCRDVTWLKYFIQLQQQPLFSHLLSWDYSQVNWYQECNINLDFTEARDSEWQWHQLGNIDMHVCTSLQADNHTSTLPLSCFTGRMPFCRPTNSVKALKPINCQLVNDISSLH